MAKKTKRFVLYLVGTDCAPALETEFNDWYSNTHIPEIMRQRPGFVSAQRYEIVGPPQAGYPRFLAIYEMTDEAAYNSFVDFVTKARAAKTAWFTPGPKFNVVWSAAYKPIDEQPKQ